MLDSIARLRMPLTINLVRNGGQMLAVLGTDLRTALVGTGDTIPGALRDLANRIEEEGMRRHDTIGSWPGLRRVK